jgi:hypothetical protein
MALSSTEGEEIVALTYTESSALMTDVEFRGRIKVACLKFANYIFDEAVNVPAHASRLRWAQRTFQTPDASASDVQPTVVMDQQVQADGAAITDAALQTTVEISINKML